MHHSPDGKLKCPYDEIIHKGLEENPSFRKVRSVTYRIMSSHRGLNDRFQRLHAGTRVVHWGTATVGL